MRLASYNVENLFSRAKAMNEDTWSQGKPVLQKYAELNGLLGELTYTAAIKKKIAKLMTELGLRKSDQGPFVLLRRNKGALVKRPKTGPLQIVARGRADWVGSLELVREVFNETSMRNTARVMLDVDADVLGVIEAESRPTLSLFVNDVVGSIGDNNPFAHVMLIDGNDTRGIDVGLLTRAKLPIGLMRSHVDDKLPNGENVFSRDCPEFEIATPSGATLLVMVNHFKSKGFGSQASSNKRRKAQAIRVTEIYKQRIAEGFDLIAVIGDLNDTPSSEPLRPLIDQTTLNDVFKHPKFNDGGFPGTFGGCTANNKIDYIFCRRSCFPE